MRKISRKQLCVWILLAIFMLIVLFAVCVASSIVRFGKVDKKQRADVAVILGAGTWNGEISPVYRERINHGVWLYENDYADYLLLTGGVGEGNRISDAEAAKCYAVSKGIPDEVILLEERSTITEENLEYANLIMQEHRFNSAIIVSDPLHMKRAMLMTKDYGIVGYPSPTPTTMYQSWKTKSPFLVRETFLYIGYAVIRIFR